MKPIAADLVAETGAANAHYCRGCGKWRQPDDFSLKNAGTQRRHSQCRLCCRETSRRHYAMNRTAYLERNRRNQPRLKRAAAELVYEFLKGHPCAECGERDILVLEFNHLDPAVKSANICDLIRSCTSASGIQAEIAKCEVLCANCHQRRTTVERMAHFKRGGAESGKMPSWRRAANERNARMVLDRLSQAVCRDCAVADPLVLQFDHRSAKSKDIGWLVSSGCRADLIAAELAKCDVRCANCHRRRTARVGNWLRLRYLGEGRV
jgi:hypothetical protein